MDKYEYKVRSEEIKALIAKGEYAEAASIADTIDWRRVKSVMMLCTISDLYKINRRLEDAKDMLLLAYDRHPGGRSIVYSLCELSIKMGEFVEALGYYKEFVQVAPKDSGRYVLKYKLFEAQEVTLEERIEVLEELKSKDYSEKWAYELAYLYHRVGLGTKCVEECDELILWFGDGKYVQKALELKQLHEPLSAGQQEKYYRMKMPAETMPEPETVEEAAYMEEEPDLLSAPTREIPQKELDIQVKVMNVGQYDTINMQRELAENMKELWAESVQAQEPAALPEQNFVISESEDDPAASDTGMFDLPDDEEEEMEEVEAGDAEEEIAAAGEIKVEEVFFGETGEMDTTGPRILEEMKQETLKENQAHAASIERPIETPIEAAGSLEVSEVSADAVAEEKEVILPEAAEVPEETPKETVETPIINFFTGKPSKFDNMLGMEYDGQINMVMPDSEQIEKQITGQLQLEDVLLEWEKMKKDNEQKRMEAVRQHVLQQTGAMFTEFDAAARDGLLEQLEKSGAEEDVQEEIADSLVILEGEEAEEEAAELLDESVDTEIEEELEEISEETSEESAEGTEETTEETVAEETAEEAAKEAGAEEAAETSEEAVEETEKTTEETAVEETAEEAAKEAGSEEAAEIAEEAVEEVEKTTEETAVEETAEEAAKEETEEAAKEAAEEVAEEAGETAEEVAEESDESEEPEESQEPEAEDKRDTKAAEKEAKSAAEDETEKSQKKNVKEKDSEGDKGSKVRELSAEEQQLFGSYTQNRKTREQIVHAIDNVSMAAYTGNVIITGGEGADTLTLAKNLIKEIQQTDSNFSGKIAKISGEAMNRKEMEPILDRLKNGALVIQNCGALNEETVGRLRNSLEREHSGLIILMEDNKKAVNKLLKANARLADCFNIRIDIEELDNDSLVEYGKKYAKEREYSIDDFGMLALHTRIAERQTSDHAVTVGEVKELVDGAITRANRKSLNHFIDILLAKRYDDEDMIILREKDFM
ncbi:MAG: hypothetical protein J1E83_07555 [Lachnospiraceae bacterium]|nr:hypothetical protein [Lachnospiraceae bacterium]